MLLKEYIETEVLPLYDGFDSAHRRDHVLAVMERALQMAQSLEVDADIVYAAAAYHDLGLSVDRKTHHLESGRIARDDARLLEWFSKEQIETIAQAVEDHRASSGKEPRSLYGKIIAEADRTIDPQTVIRRTVQFGLSNYPELDKPAHFERMLAHLKEKYLEGGYLKLWLSDSPNAEGLEKLRSIAKNEQVLKSIFDKTYSELRADGRFIRKTGSADIPAVMALYDKARGIMRSSGNTVQWVNGYPSENQLCDDIARGFSFVLEDKGEIIGTAACVPGVEPTYVNIYEGNWLEDSSDYVTIHRMGSTPESHGVAKEFFDWASRKWDNIRVDTHRDNAIMRHCVEKAGFCYCGIIYIADGTERLAYQLINPVSR